MLSKQNKLRHSPFADHSCLILYNFTKSFVNEHAELLLCFERNAIMPAEREGGKRMHLKSTFSVEHSVKAHQDTILAAPVLPEGLNAPFDHAWG